MVLNTWTYQNDGISWDVQTNPVRGLCHSCHPLALRRPCLCPVKMASPASHRSRSNRQKNRIQKKRLKDEYKQPKRLVCTEIYTVHFFADIVPVATRDSVNSRRKFNTPHGPIGDPAFPLPLPFLGRRAGNWKLSGTVVNSWKRTRLKFHGES